MSYLHSLVDDAATFPPRGLPLGQAVTDHRRHLSGPYAGLVGCFVVSDTRLAELARLTARPTDRPSDRPAAVPTSAVPTSDAPPLAVSVVVTGGAGALEPAVLWAVRSPGLALRALEITLRDEDDLSRNAARVVAMLDHLRSAGHLVDDVEAYVELPRPVHVSEHGWLGALDEIAMAGLRLKLRTGGVGADTFPAPDELARCIDAALDRETPFKATAGLHDAVRHTDPATGFAHHGFLNVLLATRVALDGGDVEAALRSHTPAEEISSGPTTEQGWQSARRWFTSFGSCSVDDVHEDLVGLGLWKDT
jgi:hypothetical protein